MSGNLYNKRFGSCLDPQVVVARLHKRLGFLEIKLLVLFVESKSYLLQMLLEL